MDVDTQFLDPIDASQLSIDVISSILGVSQSMGDVDLIHVVDQAKNVENEANMQQPLSKHPNPKNQQKTQFGIVPNS